MTTAKPMERLLLKLLDGVGVGVGVLAVVGTVEPRCLE